uniref:Putative zinc finger protein 8 n=1 Tax=Davidia involucrata TaxID=16924 RepID=A0A5B6YM03_DAVIN
MEKTEKETHDFMNVESFSQLPFIRPAPAKEKGIRLFGKEFGGGSGGDTESESVDTNAFEEVAVKDNDNNNNGESSRKFECHYCCRNFPTSQALGGHQNAHKRERQHAKRAHLQSAMLHSTLSDANHLYGLMNYRVGSAQTPSMTNYGHSWNSNSTNARTFYGSYHGGSYSSQYPPINGSPLALWRIPAVQNSPTFNSDRSMHPVPSSSPLIGSSDSQSRYVCESKPSVQDHVSLDLHL